MTELPSQLSLAMLQAMSGKGSGDTRPSDVDCPDCDQKLVYTEPGIIHHDPPRMRVKCLSCGHKGFVPVDPPENVLMIEPTIIIPEAQILSSSASQSDEQTEDKSDPASEAS